MSSPNSPHQLELEGGSSGRRGEDDDEGPSQTTPAEGLGGSNSVAPQIMVSTDSVETTYSPLSPLSTTVRRDSRGFGATARNDDRQKPLRTPTQLLPPPSPGPETHTPLAASHSRTSPLLASLQSAGRQRGASSATTPNVTPSATPHGGWAASSFNMLELSAASQSRLTSSINALSPLTPQSTQIVPATSSDSQRPPGSTTFQPLRRYSEGGEWSPMSTPLGGGVGSSQFTATDPRPMLSQLHAQEALPVIPAPAIRRTPYTSGSVETSLGGFSQDFHAPPPAATHSHADPRMSHTQLPTAVHNSADASTRNTPATSSEINSPGVSSPSFANRPTTRLSRPPPIQLLPTAAASKSATGSSDAPEASTQGAARQTLVSNASDEREMGTSHSTNPPNPSNLQTTFVVSSSERSTSSLPNPSRDIHHTPAFVDPTHSRDKSSAVSPLASGSRSSIAAMPHHTPSLPVPAPSLPAKSDAGAVVATSSVAEDPSEMSTTAGPPLVHLLPSSQSVRITRRHHKLTSPTSMPSSINNPPSRTPSSNSASKRPSPSSANSPSSRFPTQQHFRRHGSGKRHSWGTAPRQGGASGAASPNFDDEEMSERSFLTKNSILEAASTSAVEELQQQLRPAAKEKDLATDCSDEVDDVGTEYSSEMNNNGVDVMEEDGGVSSPLSATKRLRKKPNTLRAIDKVRLQSPNNHGPFNPLYDNNDVFAYSPNKNQQPSHRRINSGDGGDEEYSPGQHERHHRRRRDGSPRNIDASSVSSFDNTLDSSELNSSDLEEEERQASKRRIEQRRIMVKNISKRRGCSFWMFLLFLGVFAMLAMGTNYGLLEYALDKLLEINAAASVKSITSTTVHAMMDASAQVMRTARTLDSSYLIGTNIFDSTTMRSNMGLSPKSNFSMMTIPDRYHADRYSMDMSLTAADMYTDLDTFALMPRSRDDARFYNNETYGDMPGFIAAMEWARQYYVGQRVGICAVASGYGIGMFKFDANMTLIDFENCVSTEIDGVVKSQNGTTSTTTSAPSLVVTQTLLQRYSAVGNNVSDVLCELLYGENRKNWPPPGETYANRKPPNPIFGGYEPLDYYAIFGNGSRAYNSSSPIATEFWGNRFLQNENFMLAILLSTDNTFYAALVSKEIFSSGIFGNTVAKYSTATVQKTEVAIVTNRVKKPDPDGSVSDGNGTFNPQVLVHTLVEGGEEEKKESERRLMRLFWDVCDGGNKYTWHVVTRYYADNQLIDASAIATSAKTGNYAGYSSTAFYELVGTWTSVMSLSLWETSSLENIPEPHTDAGNAAVLCAVFCVASSDSRNLTQSRCDTNTNSNMYLVARAGYMTESSSFLRVVMLASVLGSLFVFVVLMSLLLTVVQFPIWLLQRRMLEVVSPDGDVHKLLKDDSSDGTPSSPAVSSANDTTTPAAERSITKDINWRMVFMLRFKSSMKKTIHNAHCMLRVCAIKATKSMWIADVDNLIRYFNFIAYLYLQGRKFVPQHVQDKLEEELHGKALDDIMFPLGEDDADLEAAKKAKQHHRHNSNRFSGTTRSNATFDNDWDVESNNSQNNRSRNTAPFDHPSRSTRSGSIMGGVDIMLPSAAPAVPGDGASAGPPHPSGFHSSASSLNNTADFFDTPLVIEGGMLNGMGGVGGDVEMHDVVRDGVAPSTVSASFGAGGARADSPHSVSLFPIMPTPSLPGSAINTARTSTVGGFATAPSALQLQGAKSVLIPLHQHAAADHSQEQQAAAIAMSSLPPTHPSSTPPLARRSIPVAADGPLMQTAAPPSTFSGVEVTSPRLSKSNRRSTGSSFVFTNKFGSSVDLTSASAVHDQHAANQQHFPLSPLTVPDWNGPSEDASGDVVNQQWMPMTVGRRKPMSPQMPKGPAPFDSMGNLNAAATSIEREAPTIVGNVQSQYPQSRLCLGTGDPLFSGSVLGSTPNVCLSGSIPEAAVNIAGENGMEGLARFDVKFPSPQDGAATGAAAQTSSSVTASRQSNPATGTSSASSRRLQQAPLGIGSGEVKTDSNELSATVPPPPFSLSGKPGPTQQQQPPSSVAGTISVGELPAASQQQRQQQQQMQSTTSLNAKPKSKVKKRPASQYAIESKTLDEYIHFSEMEARINPAMRLRAGGKAADSKVELTVNALRAKRKDGATMRIVDNCTVLVAKLGFVEEAYSADFRRAEVDHNAIFLKLTKICAKHRGAAFWRMGDVIGYCWNAFETTPSHALKAVKCAVAIAEWFADARRAGLRMGISVHQGPAVCGTLGDDKLAAPALVGEISFTAYHLAELAMNSLKSPVVVTERVKTSISIFYECLIVDVSKLDDKSHPLTVFEVRGVTPRPSKSAKLLAPSNGLTPQQQQLRRKAMSVELWTVEELTDELKEVTKSHTYLYNSAFARFRSHQFDEAVKSLEELEQEVHRHNSLMRTLTTKLHPSYFTETGALIRNEEDDELLRGIFTTFVYPSSITFGEPYGIAQRLLAMSRYFGTAQRDHKDAVGITEQAQDIIRQLSTKFVTLTEKSAWQPLFMNDYDEKNREPPSTTCSESDEIALRRTIGKDFPNIPTMNDSEALAEAIDPQSAALFQAPEVQQAVQALAQSISAAKILRTAWEDQQGGMGRTPSPSRRITSNGGAMGGSSYASNPAPLFGHSPPNGSFTSPSKAMNMPPLPLAPPTPGQGAGHSNTTNNLFAAANASQQQPSSASLRASGMAISNPDTVSNGSLTGTLLHAMPHINFSSVLSKEALEDVPEETRRIVHLITNPPDWEVTTLRLQLRSLLNHANITLIQKQMAHCPFKDLQKPYSRKFPSWTAFEELAIKARKHDVAKNRSTSSQLPHRRNKASTSNLQQQAAVQSDASAGQHRSGGGGGLRSSLPSSDSGGTSTTNPNPHIQAASTSMGSHQSATGRLAASSEASNFGASSSPRLPNAIASPPPSSVSRTFKDVLVGDSSKVQTPHLAFGGGGHQVPLPAQPHTGQAPGFADYALFPPEQSSHQGSNHLNPRLVPKPLETFSPTPQVDVLSAASPSHRGLGHRSEAAGRVEGSTTTTQGGKGSSVGVPVQLPRPLSGRHDRDHHGIAAAAKDDSNSPENSRSRYATSPMRAHPNGSLVTTPNQHHITVIVPPTKIVPPIRRTHHNANDYDDDEEEEDSVSPMVRASSNDIGGLDGTSDKSESGPLSFAKMAVNLSNASSGKALHRTDSFASGEWKDTKFSSELRKAAQVRQFESDEKHRLAAEKHHHHHAKRTPRISPSKVVSPSLPALTGASHGSNSRVVHSPRHPHSGGSVLSDSSDGEIVAPGAFILPEATTLDGLNPAHNNGEHVLGMGDLPTIDSCSNSLDSSSSSTIVSSVDGNAGIIGFGGVRIVGPNADGDGGEEENNVAFDSIESCTNSLDNNGNGVATSEENSPLLGSGTTQHRSYFGVGGVPLRTLPVHKEEGQAEEVDDGFESIASCSNSLDDHQADTAAEVGAVVKKQSSKDSFVGEAAAPDQLAISESSEVALDSSKDTVVSLPPHLQLVKVGSGSCGSGCSPRGTSGLVNTPRSSLATPSNGVSPASTLNGTHSRVTKTSSKGFASTYSNNGPPQTASPGGAGVPTSSNCAVATAGRPPVATAHHPPRSATIGHHHRNAAFDKVSSSATASSLADFQKNLRDLNSKNLPPIIETKNGTIYSRSDTMLGAGSYGKVYLGMEEHTGQLVAMKVMPLPDDPDEVEKIENEVSIMRSVHDENLVDMYDYCIVKSRYIVLVMECIVAGSLSSMLTSFKHFAPQTVANFLKDVVRGLATLHAADIIHRDVKPQNVLVTSSGKCKISDFGASARISALARSAGEGGGMVIQGTPLYLAPEAARGRPTLKSDIWSVGIMFLHLVTGKPPYSAEDEMLKNPMVFTLCIAKQTIRPIIPPDLPPEARDFVEACLRPEEDRPTANDLLHMPFLL